MGKFTAFAQGEGLAATSNLSADEQKAFGQFMTPPDIAHVMAQRACAGIDRDVVRVLEPSAPFPALLTVDQIRERLDAIFPEAFPNRGFVDARDSRVGRPAARPHR